MVARYEVLARTFIEPWLLEKGSVIEMEGSPGPHLLPMNEEAKAAFEDWYKEEHPVFDKDGEPIFYLDESGSRVQKFYKPHEVFRRVVKPATTKPRFTLVEGPPKPKPEELNHTLAGLGIKQATADVRPGPDRVRTFEAEAASAAEAELPPEDAPKAEILRAPKLAKRDIAKEIADEAALGASLASAAVAAGKAEVE